MRILATEVREGVDAIGHNGQYDRRCRLGEGRPHEQFVSRVILHEQDL
jgi:hypothetical protein